MSEARFAGTRRHFKHEPIVPAREGVLPAFAVICLTAGCGYAHDAHGLTAEDAVKAVAPAHQAGHQLTARRLDYAAGWERPGQPLAGVPATTGGHPLYRA